MKKTRILSLLLVLMFGGVSALKAQLQMPSVFTDGMVLQQKSKVTVWGWGNPADKIMLLGNWLPEDTVYAVVDHQGCWKAEMETSAAGGPYELIVKSNQECLTVKDVMLGEVWLCSGQSNMEWSVNNGILNGEEEAAKASCHTLRIFHQPKQGAAFPQTDSRTHWEIASPQSMRKTSATAYFFARYLTEHLQVPVGIIVAAWGGTPAEVWTPAEVINNDPVLAANKTDNTPWWPNEPGVLYNQMIHPVIPYAIAGCIWYQGESNHGNATSYCQLTTKMVESWRKRFGKDFPFYYVQIAPHTYNSKGNTPALLREQQQMMLNTVPNTGMINISDLVENVSDIHPRNKRAIGERLAFMVMDRHYDRFMQPYESPYLQQTDVRKNEVILTFAGDFTKLVSLTKDIQGIVVSDANGVPYPVKVKIKGKTLRVSVKGIKTPYRICYCFDDATIGSLRTESGLPVLPFRTNLINI